MNETIKQIGETGIVPVVTIEDPESAVPVGKALEAGDIPIAEITFRTDAAEESIKRLSSEIPGMLIGAGTVLSIEQVKRAVAAGAKFIVAPGFSEKTVDYCIENNIPVIPGVNTPSEIEKALERGLEVLKFFPSETSGGLKTIKALAGPFNTVKFIPTGGITQDNFTSYITDEHIFACGGSWMVNPALIKERRFDDITNLCKLVVEIVLGFEFAHLGVNTENQDEAMANANFFGEIFSLKINPGASSVFASSEIEFIKSKGLGTHGHIAIRTNNLSRAIAWLKRKGVNLYGDLIMKDGKPVAVYIDKEIAGFAVHLLQK